ncbi:ribonuclease domain-containing protein [Streptomyces sp. NPDC058045]|uniref:ribonuclease domain-containing protein n=1 Tax=Streptomyces sp. NPDC058045 TaxID=3346311 RepID=UPI0036F12A08
MPLTPLMPLRRLLAALLAALVLLLTGCSGGTGTGDGRPGAVTATPSWARGLRAVPEARLPAEARDTLRRIDDGGPFPYRQDGSVFRNRERRLPGRDGGYYREYTVRTPGERDRGARRVVTGDGGEIYYTDDHYDSFEAVIR